MAINLHAKTDFDKGDVGRVAGHAASKVAAVSTGAGLVIALQDIKAGANGWFDKKQG